MSTTKTKSTKGRTDNERADFLVKLDEAFEDVEVTNWEGYFIAANLSVDSFSPNQRSVIDELIEKYAARIGW